MLLFDSDLDKPDTWVPLREVLELLRKCPARKLLLLDIMQPTADARIGILAEEIATLAAPELTEAARDSKLCVLVPCSPGQISLDSEELGHTVFAHFVARGLRGHAQRRELGRVTLEELAEFVTSHVDRWARANRDLRQTPCLYGNPAGFPLTSAESVPKDSGESPLQEDYPDWLEGAWKQRGDWWKDGKFHLDASAFAEFDSALLAAEHQWRGGGSEVRLKHSVKERIDAVTHQFDQRLKERGKSVPALLEDGIASASARPELLRRLGELARLAESDRKKSDEARAALLKEKEFDGKPEELCRAVFSAALREEEITKTRLALYARLLPAEEAKRHAETRLLTELAELSAPGGSWPARGVARALRAVQAQASVRSAGPRERLRGKDLLEEADRLYQEGCASLAGPEAGRLECSVLLEKAAQAYRDAGEDLKLIGQALHVWDEAAVRLPCLAAYFETAGMDRAFWTDWEASVEAVCEIRKLLAVPVPREPAARIGVIKRLRALLSVPDTLKIQEEAILREVLPRTNNPSEREGPADLKERRVKLRLASLSASQRLKLWREYRLLAGRLNRDFRTSRTGASKDQIRGAEQEQALWAARLSVSLLRLEGVTGWEELWAKLDPAARHSSDLESLRSLGDGLRKLWTSRSHVGALR